MSKSPEDGPGEIEYDSLMAASVSFAGPFAGGLVMTVSPQVVFELAANMLGVDNEETTLDQQYDALKESMNVICGNLLPAITGKQAVFNIGSPEIITGGEAIKEATEKYNGRSPTSMVRLDIDGEQCVLFLFGDIRITGE
ncbi:MAG: chemotaxis protein CheX [Deltaproteobacteria bacterium]|nr:chemotaxis protein CheX [Deltaproteobacteria bacterium]